MIWNVNIILEKHIKHKLLSGFFALVFLLKNKHDGFY